MREPIQVSAEDSLPMSNREFRRRLDALILRDHVTQEEFGKAIGLSARPIRRYADVDGGTKIPTPVAMLLRLCSRGDIVLEYSAKRKVKWVK